jgi:hypothetical protein
MREGQGAPVARPNFPPVRNLDDWSAASGGAPVPYPPGWNAGQSRAAVAKGDRSMGASGADWFGNAMRETGSSPQKVEGAADLRVKFEGLPKSSKVNSSRTECSDRSRSIVRGQCSLRRMSRGRELARASAVGNSTQR